jgi:hypothetical protein
MGDTIQLATCVVEGTRYEVGEGKAVVQIPKVGLVHNAEPLHTILGDPVQPSLLSTPNKIDTTETERGAR